MHLNHLHGATARRNYDLKVAGRTVHLGPRTLVVGVVNVTPDSFSDGGLYLNPRQAIRHALDMANQGADWIDVGGESTRPGAAPVSHEEELRRVLPVIEGIRQRLPLLPISIDTTKAEVAERAIQAGAGIVNDVSGLRFDEGVAEVAARHRVPLVLMHIRGRPATMQQRPFAASIYRSVGRGLGWSIRRATTLGVPRSQLIIDPGLGFGKTRRQNFEILARLRQLQRFDLPVLVGFSRKSFVQAIVAGESLDSAIKRNHGVRSRQSRPERQNVPAGGDKVKSRRQGRAQQSGNFGALDFGDAAAAVAAALGGAHIVRVHRVDAMVPSLRVADAIRAAATAE